MTKDEKEKIVSIFESLTILLNKNKESLAKTTEISAFNLLSGKIDGLATALKFLEEIVGKK